MKTEFCLQRRRRIPRGSGLGKGLAGKGSSGRQGRVWREWGPIQAKGAAGPHGGDVVSKFKTVLMKWMNAFWTLMSSENTHSFIVQEMVIFPTPMKKGVEPGNSRYMAFPGNESSTGNRFTETQVASEVTKSSVQVYSWLCLILT